MRLEKRPDAGSEPGVSCSLSSAAFRRKRPKALFRRLHNVLKDAKNAFTRADGSGRSSGNCISGSGFKQHEPFFPGVKAHEKIRVRIDDKEVSLVDSGFCERVVGRKEKERVPGIFFNQVIESQRSGFSVI